MAQRLSPQPPNPHFQERNTTLKANHKEIIIRQTDKTPRGVYNYRFGSRQYASEKLLLDLPFEQ